MFLYGQQTFCGKKLLPQFFTSLHETLHIKTSWLLNVSDIFIQCHIQMAY